MSLKDEKDECGNVAEAESDHVYESFSGHVFQGPTHADAA